MRFSRRKTIRAIFLSMLVGSALPANPAGLWNTTELNTGAGSTYLSTFDKEVILEINKLRSDPAKYAREYIAPMKSYYKGRMFYYPGNLPLMTREGVSALNECVRYLESQKAVAILQPSNGLAEAAKDHVVDQSRKGGTGHTGHDHSGFRNRIERYGKWKTRIAENIAYGNVTPRQVVIYLLIDDGIRSRGHRLNFLNKDFRFVGVADGTHPYYEKMCVMEFAGGFQNYASR